MAAANRYSWTSESGHGHSHTVKRHRSFVRVWSHDVASRLVFDTPILSRYAIPPAVHAGMALAGRMPEQSFQGAVEKAGRNYGGRIRLSSGQASE